MRNITLGFPSHTALARIWRALCNHWKISALKEWKAVLNKMNVDLTLENSNGYFPRIGFADILSVTVV